MLPTALTMAVDYVYNVNLTPDNVDIGNGYSSYVWGEKTIIRRFGKITGKKIKADIESSPEEKSTQWNYLNHKVAIEALKVLVVLYYRWKPGNNLHSHAIVLVGTTGGNVVNSYYFPSAKFYVKREEAIFRRLINTNDLLSSLDEYIGQYREVVRYNLKKYIPYTDTFIIHDPAGTSYLLGLLFLLDFIFIE